MKNFLRLFTLAMLFSIAVTIYFANPFVENVKAAGCWIGCDNGNASPGNRSGCRVYYTEQGYKFGFACRSPHGVREQGWHTYFVRVSAKAKIITLPSI